MPFVSVPNGPVRMAIQMLNLWCKGTGDTMWAFSMIFSQNPDLSSSERTVSRKIVLLSEFCENEEKQFTLRQLVALILILF